MQRKKKRKSKRLSPLFLWSNYEHPFEQENLSRLPVEQKLPIERDVLVRTFKLGDGIEFDYVLMPDHFTLWTDHVPKIRQRPSRAINIARLAGEGAKITQKTERRPILWAPPFNEPLKDKNYWKAMLVTPDKSEIIGFANGSFGGKGQYFDDASIHGLEINPRFRGQGYCPVLVKQIFQHLYPMETSFYNAADKIGEKCYSRGSREAGYDWSCDKFYKDGSCHHMIFKPTVKSQS